jgi:flagellar protein FliS
LGRNHPFGFLPTGFNGGGFFMIGGGFRAYQKTEVVTADPKKLVILCYEGAISSLKLAKTKLYAREYEAKGKAVQNALDLLNELRGALDFEKGGEIARNLDRLYAYWTQHILNAGMNQDPRGFDPVISMLEEIKSALEIAYFGCREGETLPLPFEVPTHPPAGKGLPGYPAGYVK